MKRTGRFEAPLTAEWSGARHRGTPAGRPATGHMHPGDEVLYVVEGAVVVEVESSPPKMLRAGESFQFSRATPHLARHASGRPARVLASIVYVADEPSTVMVPAQPTAG